MGTGVLPDAPRPLGTARMTWVAGIFLRDSEGRRPVYGGTETFQSDPQWRDYVLFYEYFHGDNGAGLGASHQTGWTGCVAKLIQLFGVLDARKALELGKAAAFDKDSAERIPAPAHELVGS